MKEMAAILRFRFLLLTLFAFSLPAFAQTPSSSPSPTPEATQSPSLEREFFKNILRDQKAIWTSPFHLHNSDTRWGAPLGLATASLIASDRATGDEIGEASNGVRNVSRIISYGGSGYGAGFFAVSFYAVGRLKHNARARETGVLSAEALIDSALVVTAIKEITQRARPLAGGERSEFFEKGSSFPSGHSISAWSVATVVASEYHGHPLIQAIAYGLAGSVSVARFTGRNHYLSDILVGSGLGYGIGRYVYHTHHRKISDSGGGEEEEEVVVRSHSKLWPLIAPEYSRSAHDYGVALAWNF